MASEVAVVGLGSAEESRGGREPRGLEGERVGVLMLAGVAVGPASANPSGVGSVRE